jgi:hypothetical protein
LGGAAQLLSLGVSERMSPKIRLAVVVLVFLAGVFAVRFYFYAHIVDRAEDRRRWLREIDAENAKSGFIKDTNEALIYVGTTNQVIAK